MNLHLKHASAYADFWFFSYWTNISIAGQAIANEFHLTNIQLGWIFSAFVLGDASLHAPAGRISDRLGPRVVLGFGMVWWAVFTTLITIYSCCVTSICRGHGNAAC